MGKVIMKALVLFHVFLLPSALRRVIQGANETQQDMQQSNETQGGSLRNWLQDGRCFNVMMSPELNSQHSIFGVMDSLLKHGLLNNMKGISACSGGTLPAAFFAAGKNYDHFKMNFPKDGWSGLGPSEPKISFDYQAFLARSGIPRDFKYLKHPLALSLTHWDSESAMKTWNRKKAHGFVASKGPDLYEAMIAGVMTSNAADPNCPKCKIGFHPRTIQGMYPMSDGGQWDMWGSGGLQVLPACPKVLHILPLDYQAQEEPPALETLNVPPQTKEMLTLRLVQPAVASQSYTIVPMQKYLLKNPVLTKKDIPYWNTAMYQGIYDGIASQMDQPLRYKQMPYGNTQVVMDINNHLTEKKTVREEIFSRASAIATDDIWQKRRWDVGTNPIVDDPAGTVGLLVGNRVKQVQRLADDVKAGTFATESRPR